MWRHKTIILFPQKCIRPELIRLCCACLICENERLDKTNFTLIDAIQPGGRIWSWIHPSSLEAEYRLQSNHPAQVLNDLWVNEMNFTFHRVSKYIYCLQWPKNLLQQFWCFLEEKKQIGFILLYWETSNILTRGKQMNSTEYSGIIWKYIWHGTDTCGYYWDLLKIPNTW